jgi:hypothetical protein
MLILPLPAIGIAAEPVRVVPESAFPVARQPQAAVSPGGKVFIVFGVDDAIYCSISADGGKSYQAPVKVGQQGVMALGMRRGPRVAATDRAVVVTAICGPVGRGKDGDVLAWRSSDEGKTWQGPVKVNTVAGSAREGLHHTAAGPDGLIYCTWLDLRDGRSVVYGAASTDGGATWPREQLVYASPERNVCECCQPSVAFDAGGGVHVMWRNNLAGARDMYLCSSKDHGVTFGPAAKLGEGTWPLRACPMDGGALAGTSPRELVTVWMRNKELFRCTPGQPEVSLGRGEQAWAAAAPGGVSLIWIKTRPGSVLLLTPGAREPRQLSDRGFDPVLAAAPNGKGPVIAVWEEGNANRMGIRAMVVEAGTR